MLFFLQFRQPQPSKISAQISRKVMPSLLFGNKATTGVSDLDLAIPFFLSWGLSDSSTLAHVSCNLKTLQMIKENCKDWHTEVTNKVNKTISI